MFENEMAASKPSQNLPAVEKSAEEYAHEVQRLGIYLRALVNNSHGYYLLLDSDMKILYYSDSLLRVTGMVDGELLVGKPVHEIYKLFHELFYDKNYSAGAIRRLQRAFSGEENFYENDTIVLPSGEKRLYQINYKKLTSAVDSIEGVLIFAQDITDLRFEEAKKRVDAMLHSSVLPCYVCDENGDVLAFNSEIPKVFEISKDMSPSDFGEVMVLLLQPKFQPCGEVSESVRQKLLKEALQTGFAQTESFLQTKAGDPLFVRITVLRALWPFGFRLIVYIQDKTEKCLGRKELARIREQNELHLAKLNLVVNVTGVSLWSVEIDRVDPTNPKSTAIFSDAYRKMLGFSDAKDFPNVFGSWSDRLHPADAENALDQLRAHVSDTSGKTPYSTEYRLLRKDGKYGYFRASGEAERDRRGNAIRMSVALMDITHEKNTLLEAEKQGEELERIREQKELLLTKWNLMVKASSVGLWNVTFARNDAKNPIVAVWSDDLRQMLGFSGEHDFPNVLESWANQLHPDDKESAIEQMTRHMMDLSGQTPYDAEFRLLHKNGQYGYYRAFGETLRDADGKALSMSGALIDITEAKEIQHNAEQKSAELRHIREQNEYHRAKLHMVAQATGASLWDMQIARDDPLNPANSFTWSDDFRRMLGFTDENDFPDLLGSWSDRLHPDDKERTLEQAGKHLSDTSGKTPFDVQYRLMKKDGQYGYFRATGSAFRDEEGNPVRIAGTLVDITETKNPPMNAEK